MSEQPPLQKLAQPAQLAQTRARHGNTLVVIHSKANATVKISDVTTKTTSM